MANIKRYKEIFEDLKASLIAQQDKITDFNEGSIIHTIIDTMARLGERQYISIRQGYNEMLSLLPFSAFKFEKKTGTKSIGQIKFFRESPIDGRTLIPSGVVLSSGNLKFITSKEAVIEPNEIFSNYVETIAELKGSKYNISSEEIDSIDTVVPIDVVGAVNDNPFSGGTDEETETQYQERFKFFINGLSGTNTFAIQNEVLKFEEIRSVSLQEHKPPLENIYNLSIYIDDGTGNIAQNVIDKVTNRILGDNTTENEGHLAPGINIRVLRPSVVPIDISVAVNISGKDKSEAQYEIKTAIKNYIDNLTIGYSIYLSELTKIIMDIPYVVDCNFVKEGDQPVDNIYIDANQLARSQKISVNILEV